MPEPELPETAWVDEEAGPLVRHYAKTAGRTRPTRADVELDTIVTAVGAPTSADADLGPEHATIVRLCQNRLSVTELATRLDLPAGTVLVLLGDLLDRGLIRTRSPKPAPQLPAERVFKAVLDGLRSL
jgi:uncharacterized protein DUF742